MTPQGQTHDPWERPLSEAKPSLPKSAMLAQARTTFNAGRRSGAAFYAQEGEARVPGRKKPRPGATVACIKPAATPIRYAKTTKEPSGAT